VHSRLRGGWILHDLPVLPPGKELPVLCLSNSEREKCRVGKRRGYGLSGPIIGTSHARGRGDTFYFFFFFLPRLVACTQHAATERLTRHAMRSGNFLQGRKPESQTVGLRCLDSRDGFFVTWKRKFKNFSLCWKSKPNCPTRR